MSRLSETTPLTSAIDPPAYIDIKADPVAKLSSSTTEAVSVAWTDVHLSIGKKVILDGLRGLVPAGGCCAIMGPSGSGKTSLLNVLAGRTKTNSKNTVSGSIAIGGVIVNPSEFRSEIAYVLQEDALTPTATPREALLFSAHLRLPASIASKDKEKLVDGMIEALGLQHCANTLIGSVLRRGISGGEKKRTAIGVELVTQPRVLFLDEPTSGLDSYAAYRVVTLLHSLTQTQGCTILCTIHQPSSEVFHEFDNLVLLAQGRCAYSGPTKELCPFFQRVGHEVPQNYNPADFVLMLLQSESQAEMNKITTANAIANLDNSAQLTLQKASHTAARALLSRLSVNRASMWTQLAWLTDREGKDVTRDRTTLIARFGVLIVLNLIFSLIFYKIGKSSDIQSHFGALTQIMIGALMSSAQPLILQFPLERPIFVREYAVGTYSSIPYFFSKTVVELVLSFLSSAVTWLVAYWLMGLQGSIIILILSSWILSLVSASIALLLGCIATDVKSALQAAPAILVPQMMFAGFFIKISEIPVYLRWAQYICALKFAMNLAMITEFGSCEPSDSERCLKAEGLLKSNEVHKELWYVYLAILAGLFVLFRGMALCFLTAQASS